MISMGMKHLSALAIIAMSAFAVSAAWGAEPVTAKEAEAMVKKGVGFIKANGKEAGYAEISNKGGQFHDRDLYLAVHQLDGKCVAHGTNEKMVGKNFIDLKDVDGKEYIKERVELAKTRGTFWTDYKFVNPLSKKVEPKTAYCERLDDAVVCGGVYKK